MKKINKLTMEPKEFDKLNVESRNLIQEVQANFPDEFEVDFEIEKPESGDVQVYNDKTNNGSNVGTGKGIFFFANYKNRRHYHVIIGRKNGVAEAKRVGFVAPNERFYDGWDSGANATLIVYSKTLDKHYNFKPYWGRVSVVMS